MYTTVPKQIMALFHYVAVYMQGLQFFEQFGYVSSKHNVIPVYDQHVKIKTYFLAVTSPVL